MSMVYTTVILMREVLWIYRDGLSVYLASRVWGELSYLNNRVYLYKLSKRIMWGTVTLGTKLVHHVGGRDLNVPWIKAGVECVTLSELPCLDAFHRDKYWITRRHLIFNIYRRGGSHALHNFHTSQLCLVCLQFSYFTYINCYLYFGDFTISY